MAKTYGARQSSKQEVIYTAPSVNLTKIGKHVVPVPYPVTYKLDKSEIISTDVFLNSDAAYRNNSDTTNVKGDGKGSKGGVISGTVEAKAWPVQHSPSVRINGEWAIRCGDLHKMQGGNTFGKLTCSSKPNSPAINDEGKIEACEGEK